MKDGGGRVKGIWSDGTGTGADDRYLGTLDRNAIVAEARICGLDC